MTGAISTRMASRTASAMIAESLGRWGFRGWGTISPGRPAIWPAPRRYAVPAMGPRPVSEPSMMKRARVRLCVTPDADRLAVTTQRPRGAGAA